MVTAENAFSNQVVQRGYECMHASKCNLSKYLQEEAEKAEAVVVEQQKTRAAESSECCPTAAEFAPVAAARSD
jgi:hypothetical protein